LTKCGLLAAFEKLHAKAIELPRSLELPIWYCGVFLRIICDWPGDEEIWNTIFFHPLRAEN
jgi:hypothetical protein